VITLVNFRLPGPCKPPRLRSNRDRYEVPASLVRLAGPDAGDLGLIGENYPRPIMRARDLWVAGGACVTQLLLEGVDGSIG
jgi:hypothetical protein